MYVEDQRSFFVDFNHAPLVQYEGNVKDRDHHVEIFFVK